MDAPITRFVAHDGNVESRRPKRLVREDFRGTEDTTVSKQVRDRAGGVNGSNPASYVEPYVGNGRAMTSVCELARLAASHEEPVILTGETGTGKGELARWIHRHSRRASRPFVELNCATLRGDLMLTELFGHTRGAFTSALRDRRGLVEEADSGTLFLDEIGDMDPAAQAQLLKVIEERTFRRVGEVQLRHSNFRLVCASHRDLWGDVEVGRFRRDLYFRINVFPIEIPPLRERTEDFDALVEYLLASLRASSLRVDPETLVLLRAHPWPGNVRELRNALLRATLLARDGVLLPEHFPILERRPSMVIGTAAPAEVSSVRILAGDDDETIRTKILRAIAQHDGNRTRVARTLGIGRTTLYRHLQRLGLKDARRPSRR